MRLLGTILMILGALATAAGLLAFAGPGLREIGFVLVTGVTSPIGALIGGMIMLAVGAILRRRAGRSGARAD